jgi:hypothetical protein
MAPAPSEPRDTTFASRDPAVHRLFGLFADASDLLVFAHGGAPETTSHMERPRPCGERGVSRSHLAPAIWGRRGDPTLAASPLVFSAVPALQGTPKSSATEVMAQLAIQRPSRAVRRRARMQKALK